MRDAIDFFPTTRSFVTQSRIVHLIPVDFDKREVVEEPLHLYTRCLTFEHLPPVPNFRTSLRAWIGERGETLERKSRTKNKKKCLLGELGFVIFSPIFISGRFYVYSFENNNFRLRLRGFPFFRRLVKISFSLWLGKGKELTIKCAIC